MSIPWGLPATIEAIEPPPSGRENAIVNQGNGNCVPKKIPAKNGVADFKTTTFSDGESIVTKRSEFYEEVTSAITITAIKHTTSVGSSQAVTSNRHTSYFESLEGMFFNSENNSAIITSGINFPPSTENVSATYSPALFIGPSDILCEGQEWFSASVTQTTSSISDLTGNGPAVSQTLPTNFGIDSIGDIVTVPGGTYSTIKNDSFIPKQPNNHLD